MGILHGFVMAAILAYGTFVGTVAAQPLPAMGVQSVRSQSRLAERAPARSSDGIIKAGDVLKITVVNNRLFSGVYVVSSDGTLPYPFMKKDKVAGWTMSNLEYQIANKIAPVLLAPPFVIVDRAAYFSIRVSILGQIKKPGFLEVPNGIDLQGALWMAGGPRENSDLTNIQVQRIGPDGNLELTVVNLEKFLFEGRAADLVRMQEGDLIIVKGAPNADKVKVFGEVSKSGSYVRPYGATVLDMIYLAGGTTSNGTLSDVRWLRKVGDRTIEQKLNLAGLLRQGRTGEIPLVGRGDVIIVQKRLLTMGIVFQTLTLVIQFLTVRELIRR